MKYSNKTSISLWIVQGLLALFFALGSGAPKLLLPMEMLPMPLPLPEGFIRFIGTAEVLGALVRADAEKWWPIIKESGIRAE